MAIPMKPDIAALANQDETIRKRRTLRKKIEDRVEELQAEGLDCDPVKVLMELSCGKAQGADGLYRPIIGGYDEEGNPIILDAVVRVKAASELMSYLYPKRKAIELTGREGTPITFAVIADESEGLPPGASAELADDKPGELPASDREPLTLIGVVEEEPADPA